MCALPHAASTPPSLLPLPVPGTAVPLASPTVSLAVRWLHVVAATVALGGAVLVWGALRESAVADLALDADAALSLAAAYEWLFWIAAGLLAATGVGNLGSFAPTLPGGSWTATLAWKLAAVLLVLFGSAARSLLVVRWRSAPPADRPGRRTIRVLYAATAVALGGVVVLAEVLAHG